MRILTCLVFLVCFIAVNSCGEEELTTIQQKELTLFGMRAMGADVAIDDIKEIPTESGIKTLVATGLNLNGYLCAYLDSISPQKTAGIYHIRCSKNISATEWGHYVINVIDGTAYERCSSFGQTNCR